MRHTASRFASLILFVSIVFCPALLESVFAGDDPRMSVEERAKVKKYLAESEAELMKAIEKLSEAQWKFKPAPDKWSVGEVAEHIVLAEGLLFAMVEKAVADKPNPDWEAKTKGKTELLERILVNRTGRAQAPEQIVPSGKLSRDEVIAKFKEVRARTNKFATNFDQPLKDHTVDHMFPVFGTLNGYQWLIYVPLHNLRHNQQINEVKTHKDFPSK